VTTLKKIHVGQAKMYAFVISGYNIEVGQYWGKKALSGKPTLFLIYICIVTYTEY
jgi:hypothetical protein